MEQVCVDPGSSESIKTAVPGNNAKSLFRWEWTNPCNLDPNMQKGSITVPRIENGQRIRELSSKVEIANHDEIKGARS
jgi:hypothetical protein